MNTRVRKAVKKAGKLATKASKRASVLSSTAGKSATALTLTLAGNSRGGNFAAEVSIAADTRVALRVTPAGTVTSWANCYVTIELAPP